ncbi:hypothetical protein V5799_027020 [Amblyomma americanum]|uniref:Uncharacterized protein n=1 Tax=Amblyomma americanum TaxID=6943 RepID=A0AAQ4DGX6_AMBAM
MLTTFANGGTAQPEVMKRRANAADYTRAAPAPQPRQTRRYKIGSDVLVDVLLLMWRGQSDYPSSQLQHSEYPKAARHAA